MDYVSNRLGKAPLRKNNPFRQHKSTAHACQPNFMYNGMSMQAIHTALVYRTLYGPGKAGRHGTTMVTEANVNVTLNTDIQSLLRACNGYYTKNSNVPMMRIASLSFFDMCLFLGVNPLQLFASSQAEVWDPATGKILKISLYESRKRWSD